MGKKQVTWNIDSDILERASGILESQGLLIEDVVSAFLAEVSEGMLSIGESGAEPMRKPVSAQWEYEIKADGSAKITAIRAEEELAGEVVIPSELDGHPVTALKNKLFNEYKHITKVVLPESLTELGDATFAICNSLRSINFPSGLKVIPPDCFNECGFTELVIPDTVERIRRGAFVNNRELRQIALPSGLEEIELMTFSGCGKLQDIVLPDGVKVIGDGAFSSCESMKAVVIPTGIEKIGTMAFLACKSLLQVVVPQNTEIGTLALPETAIILYV